MAYKITPFAFRESLKSSIFNAKFEEIELYLNNMAIEIQTLTQQMNIKTGQVELLNGTYRNPSGVLTLSKSAKTVSLLLNIKLPNPLQFESKKDICKLSFLPNGYYNLMCQSNAGMNAIVLAPDGVIYTFNDIFVPGEFISIFGTYLSD